MQNTSTKSIVVIAVLLILGFLAYTFFFKPGEQTPILTTEKPILLQDNVKGKELLKILLSLKNIKLDDEIFSSALFTNLQDMTITLPDVGGKGRKNPFAPIGSD